MSNPNFIDYVKIFCKSGNGGKGSSHFRREKFAPKGGPDGGDGGRGGNIILKGNKQLWTLLHLKFTKHVVAENGGDGSGSKKYGSNGKDTIIEVPLGTIAKSSEKSKKKLEILNHNEEKILLKGGIGGLGNDHFKSPTNQAPQYSQTGKVGIEEWITLELKVLADVGLVGFPTSTSGVGFGTRTRARRQGGQLGPSVATILHQALLVLCNFAPPSLQKKLGGAILGEVWGSARRK